MLEAVHFISRKFHTDQIRANRKRFFITNKYLLIIIIIVIIKRYFITASKALSEELEVLGTWSPRNLKSSTCLCLQERALAGVRRDQTGTTGSRIAELSAWIICVWRMQVEKVAQGISVIACTDDRHNDRSCKHSLRTHEKKKHPRKISKLIILYPGVYHKYNRGENVSLGIYRCPDNRLLHSNTHTHAPEQNHTLGDSSTPSTTSKENLTVQTSTSHPMP